MCPDSDPYQDYFEKQAEQREERVAKNEYHRLRNISRTQKGRVRGIMIRIISSTNIYCILGIFTVKIFACQFLC